MRYIIIFFITIILSGCEDTEEKVSDNRIIDSNPDTTKYEGISSVDKEERRFIVGKNYQFKDVITVDGSTDIIVESRDSSHRPKKYIIYNGDDLSVNFVIEEQK